MRIYKLKAFAKWAKKERISDLSLKRAIKEIEEGLIDANLGGGVYKKRLPVKGRGKSAELELLLDLELTKMPFLYLGF